MHGVAEQVDDLLAATGLKTDPHGVTASGSAMAWPAGEWRETIGRLARRADRRDPDGDLDSARRSHHPGAARHSACSPPCGTAKKRPRILRLLLRLALASRPPTGFLHDIVVEHSGEHRGSFDIKRGGLLPIVGIARYAGLAAGAEVHVHGLAAASCGSGGGVARVGCRDLEEAYRLMTELRMEHQVRAAGGRDRTPTTTWIRRRLNALTRRYLRDAFRLVASTQKTLRKTLDTGQVWER